MMYIQLDGGESINDVYVVSVLDYNASNVIVVLLGKHNLQINVSILFKVLCRFI